MANFRKRNELRREMRLVVDSLDKRWVQAASRDLSIRLEKLVETLHQATPINHVLAMTAHFHGEVDLSFFIAQQLGKRSVYLPRIVGERKMRFVRMEENWLSQIETGAFGIPEPRLDAGATFDTALARDAVVIVPGLAFDRHGNRLGRGKGYYNAFLQPPMTHAAIVGIGWDLQLVSEVPSDSDRAAMTWLCTETQVLNTQLAD